mgnify:FL=1|tara:strand:+ start:977 stop:2050 length:1074 start_codon:yes stop_codon:yes gene_type:complete
MSIDFATFNAVVPHVIDAGFPVLIRGRHGIGKSEVVYQFAKEHNLPVVERRASQMTEGDLMGLPSIDGESTRWNAPDWLKEACDNGVVLFLDEVDRATMEVRQGIFELTDSRKLNGWHLHPKTRIFAAVNGGEHAGASSYQVGEMDPAELDRWTVFDVEPTVSDWLTWSKDKVNGLVWDFVNQNHAHLEHMPDAGGYEPNKVYPSRRSWVRFSDTVDSANLLTEPKQNLASIYNLAASFLGFEAAVSFRDFAENYERMVTIEDIIDHGKVELTKDFGINEHLAICEKLEASELLITPLSATQIQNLANWFVTLPSEVAMKLFATIGANADNSNVIALHGAHASNGQSVLDFIVEIVG